MPVLPLPEIRKAISEAVHRAVLDVTDTDGKYCCLLYALTGCVLSRRILQRDYRLQVGSLHFKVKHQNERWIYWDAREDALSTGSFHAWYSCEHPHGVEIVDLSSRHYQAIADRCHRKRNEPLFETLEKANPLWTWADNLIKKGYIKLFSNQKLVEQTNTLAREQQSYFQIIQLAYEYFQPTKKIVKQLL